jgi:hypothetical protein
MINECLQKILRSLSVVYKENMSGVFLAGSPNLSCTRWS